MAVVSVTELNQQTAKVLERVKAGESLEVSEHGRLIARLVPVLQNASPLDRLIHEGRAIAAVRPETLFALVSPSSADEACLSDELAHSRAAER